MSWASKQLKFRDPKRFFKAVIGGLDDITSDIELDEAILAFEDFGEFWDKYGDQIVSVVIEAFLDTLRGKDALKDIIKLIIEGLVDDD